MSELRIKVRIADYEFEAAGVCEVVQAELAGFKKLLPNHLQTPAITEVHLPALPTIQIDRILLVDRRVVSLKVQSESVENAVLVLLFGQKHFRNNDNVTGAEIMDGLRASGYRTKRIDYVLSRHFADGAVTRKGHGRARRYRLMNPGLEKAQGILRKMAAKLPLEKPK